MFCPTPAAYVLGCLVHILPRLSLVHGAVIAQSAEMTATSSLSNQNPVKCTDIVGWVEQGIVQSDCTTAIDLFLSAVVQPHGTQEYQFFEFEKDPALDLPSVATPLKFHHGGQPAFILGFSRFSLKLFFQARASSSL